MNFKNLPIFIFFYPFAAIVLIPVTSCNQGEGRLVQNLNGEDWSVVPADSGMGEKKGYQDKNYPISEAIPAKVPGDIYWDLMRSGELPDIFVGMNAKKTYPYALKEWWYRKSFYISEKDWKNKRIQLNFSGVDYAAKIWLNGQYLGSHEGQFTPFAYDINDNIMLGNQNELTILINSAPRDIIDAFVNGNRWASNAYDIINETLKFWKCRTMTGWDWGTRLWSMGIWQDVTITATEGLYLDRLLIFPESVKPYDKAELKIKLDVNTNSYKDIELYYDVECITNEEAPKAFDSQLINTGGVNKQIEGFLEVEDPALWWPNGYGAQNLYLLTVTAKDIATGRILDRMSSRFGIREIEILDNPLDSEFIRPANSEKFLTKINGQPVFLHGGNWLPTDLLYGRPGRREYEHLIRMATLANFNVLRVFSGGLVEKQIFYDLCDQYGILVYQEMPIATRQPLETQEILDNMAKEQRLIMPLLINHPSVFRYGFGNELVNVELGEMLTYENCIHVRQYMDICRELDPSRHAIASDAVPGYQRHGPYYFRFPGTYNQYNTGYPREYAGPANPVEYSEYGASGASSLETLKRIIPDEKERWPVSPLDSFFSDFNGPLPLKSDSIWRWHNGFQAFDAMCWLVPQTYSDIFGELPDLETEIKASQFVQAEALRYANQSHRRAKWHRSGCFMWTYNEPWPNVAQGCIVEYYGLPKMAVYYVRNSYSQIDVSAKINTISFQIGDTIRLPIFITNAKPVGLNEALLNIQIVNLKGKIYYKDSKNVMFGAFSSHKVDSLCFIVPKDANDNVILLRLDLLDDSKSPISSETYTFGINNPVPGGKHKTYLRPMIDAPTGDAYYPFGTHEAYLRPLLNAPQTQLKLSVKYQNEEHWGDDKMVRYQATVKNTSNNPALFVQLKCNHRPDEVYFRDNYLILFPGEERTVDILVSPDIKNNFQTANISVDAWNL